MIFSRKRKREVADYSPLRNTERYKGDREQYKCLLYNVQSWYYQNNDNEYLDFVIDLLRKEVKHASYLELYRGRERFRYLFPFHRMDSEMIGYQYNDNTTVDLDLAKTVIISEPWKHDNYRSLYSKMKKEKEFYPEENHEAFYYEYLDVACMWNGYHSRAIGGYFGKGILPAIKYDTRKIFDYVDVKDDLTVVYNAKNIVNRCQEEKVNLPERYDECVEDKYKGTDYRLLLIYKLSKLKYQN